MMSAIQGSALKYANAHRKVVELTAKVKETQELLAELDQALTDATYKVNETKRLLLEDAQASI